MVHLPLRWGVLRRHRRQHSEHTSETVNCVTNRFYTAGRSTPTTQPRRIDNCGDEMGSTASGGINGRDDPSIACCDFCSVIRYAAVSVCWIRHSGSLSALARTCSHACGCYRARMWYTAIGSEYITTNTSHWLRRKSPTTPKRFGGNGGPRGTNGQHWIIGV